MATRKREFAIFDPKNATGSGHVARINAGELTKIISIATTGMGGGDSITIKIQGSTSDTKPNFALAASATNKWTYLKFLDLALNTTTVGATGLVIADADVVKNLEIDTAGLQWVTCEITNISDVPNTRVNATIAPYFQYVEAATPVSEGWGSSFGMTAGITKAATKLPKAKVLNDGFTLTALKSENEGEHQTKAAAVTMSAGITTGVFRA